MTHYSATIIRGGACPTAAVIDGTGRVIAIATSNSKGRAIARAIATAESAMFGVRTLATAIADAGIAAILETADTDLLLEPTADRDWYVGTLAA